MANDAQSAGQAQAAHDRGDDHVGPPRPGAEYARSSQHHGNAQTKQDVLDLIAQQFTFPQHFGKNFDALYDCMTDPLHKSGPQPGFVIVLEQIPANAKFDKEAREQLLDIFRDASDYWGDRKIPFRCFYSFL